jgi:hypothetical protein
MFTQKKSVSTKKSKEKVVPKEVEESSEEVLIEETPPKKAKAVRKKKPVLIPASAKKNKIYLLFNAGGALCNQFEDSEDAICELEGSFQGAFLSEKSAFEAFKKSMIELNVELKMQYDSSKVDEILGDCGWTILESIVED